MYMLSPIDGRYKVQTQNLRQYFSEYALFKYRVQIEIKYLIFLSQIKIVRKLTIKETSLLKNIYLNFSLTDTEKVKTIEERTKHDVKAVEYFIGQKIKSTSLANISNGYISV